MDQAIAVAGHQAGSADNGHYGGRVYYPLVASIGETDGLVGARLRGGPAHPAAEAPGWIAELADQVKHNLCQVDLVRMDAGLTDDTTLSALKDRRMPDLVHLRSNPALQRQAAPHLKRPRGRPPQEAREWTIEQRDQAGSWGHPRRAILVVQERPRRQWWHARRTYWTTPTARTVSACQGNNTVTARKSRPPYAATHAPAPSRNPAHIATATPVQPA